jgi:hypothetical protein
MTDNNAPSSSSKRALIIAGSLIVALAVVYFSFFYPPVSTSDTEGTIGAVKKYRSEQITEKDVVLEGMTSMNIESVNQAVEQTGAKLSESAREAAKTAQGLVAMAKTPEAKTYFDGLAALASKALAYKTAGADSKAPVYEQAAAIADAAKEYGLKFESLTAEAKTPEAMKAFNGVKDMQRWANGLRDLGVRAELLRLNDAAREIAVKADAMKADGKNPEWKNLADAAAAMARQSDGLKPYYGKQDLGKLSEGALAFAKCANALQAGSGKQAAEGLSAALNAAKEMGNRAGDLARTMVDSRQAPDQRQAPGQ